MAFSTSRSRGSRHGSPASDEAVLISDSEDEHLPLCMYLIPLIYRFITQCGRYS